MATIGQSLSAARIAAGRTVDDLSARTRIRPRVINGIEAEDFLPCGGDFYARGHIRALCRVLGLAPEPLLAEFDREHAGHGPPFSPHPPRRVADPTDGTRDAGGVRLEHGRYGQSTQREQAPGEGVGPEAVPAPRHTTDTTGTRGEAGAERHADTGVYIGAHRLGHPECSGHPERNGYPGQNGAPGRNGHPEWSGRAQYPGAGAGTGDDTGAPPRPRVLAPGRPAPASEPAPTPEPVPRSRGGEALRRHWPWALVVAVVLAGILVGVRAWHGEETGPLRIALETVREDSSATGPGATEADTATDTTATATAESGPRPAPAGKGVHGPAEETTVELSATERTWVQVTEDGDDLFTGFLVDGEGWDHTGQKELNLWLGDAGAVTVTVDGQDIGSPGDRGEVKEVTLGADGFGP